MDFKSEDMIDWMNNAGELSQVELVWLLVWNIAAGNWDRIGLPPQGASEFFLDFVSKLGVDPLVTAEDSRVQLQHGLMECRDVPIAEIRREPPFDDRAWHNLEALLTAWKKEGQTGLARTWHEIFSVPVNWPCESDRAGLATAERAANRNGLSDEELAWLAVWNAAGGAWDRIGLSQYEAKQFFLHVLQCQHGDALEAVKHSRGRLQQSLMALRKGSFEEIQSEAPFSLEADRNFKELVRAWEEDAEEGVTRVWNTLAPGRQRTQCSQLPIQVIGGPGDSEENALEVIGAPDQETRVAAEWWYLFYTFRRAWKWQMHATLDAKEGGRHFSMHEICMLPDRRKRIYFRLPW